MKTILSLLLFLLHIFAYSFSTQCSTTDQIKFLQCKGNIVKIQDLLALYVKTEEKIPPQSSFKNMSKLCNTALVCVEQIQCAEAKKGVGLMATACEGIEMSAGPFGDCMSKLQSKPPSSETYPCATMFQKDALDSKSKRCKVFTEDAECVMRIAKDHCGSAAVDAYKKGVPSMKIMLRC